MAKKSLAAVRTKIEKLVLQVMKDLDKTGYNYNFYKNLFKKMSNQDFIKWLKQLKNKETKLVLFTPNMKFQIKNEELLKLAEKYGVKLFERLVFTLPDGRKYLSKAEYLILHLPVRRLKQYLMDKITIPESDKKISYISGQVIKPDKGCKLNIIQIRLLATKGFDELMDELVTVRAGDLTSYQNLKAAILQKGYAYLSDIKAPTKARSVEAMAALLRSMGLDCNID